MFFIGPSVNIFVYLLVSAFFVVCFYPKEQTKLPEALPGNTVHFYNLTGNHVLHYQEVHEKQTKTEVKKIFIPRIDSPERLYYTPPAESKAPCLTLKTLRAPPTCLYFIVSVCI